VLVGEGEHGAVGRRARIEPVAELPSRVPQPVLAGALRLESNCRSSTATSPNRSRRTQGTITAASPQAAMTAARISAASASSPPKGAGTNGMKTGTLPSSPCSAARSRSHDVTIPAQS
jgi:hypothetical protein